MSETKAPDVVVLGGGSAGWITACLLHQQWAEKGGSVTVVESPEIGIIGVGEGSTPQLKAFFDQLGIAESDWMPPCNATYKLGIRFNGWSDRAGFDSYYHPFPGPVDMHSEPAFVGNCSLARHGVDVAAHPDDWFLASQLSEAGKSPLAPDNFPFAPSYGYHFDAYALGAFLRDWAVERGVTHRPLKVTEVERADDGDIAALLCEGGERIAGDLFVDCSGFRAMLAEQEMGAKFLPFADNLFNDSAVVMPTDHRNGFKPQTEATAMQAGWRWSIPLTNRIGNGYVYSSKYLSDEAAEAELRAAIGMEGSDQQARFLKMKVGRLENSWTGNCLAAGLAQGFLEPLEATALHIVIVTALEFAQAYEQGGFGPQHREAFNASIGTRYEGIRDYIVAHYRLNQRTDTPYWRDNAANDHLSPGLKRMMTAWFRHQDINAANDEAYGGKRYYANASWHCLFAGYGTFPPKDKMQPVPEGIHAADPAQMRAMLDACASNFPAYDPIST
ncbi:tryptophan halogenase family protein [Parerythrobacter jejuensis]|uniref:Tryptophan 7-halogenase n=1 Tax=Parerythrobacter jejuensis TaxID=795812 RepID=A0A845AM93_9SPHN|nr:tryptophan halogenase family protein [Parerythrobacter jejuensis]MXP31912.1 tryptophan 7-halogenase [Parerythrobacter jejuensis]